MNYKIRRTDTFVHWLNDLRDDLAVSAIAKRIARIELGNFGDAKAIGDGMRELRIHYGPGVFTFRSGIMKSFCCSVAGTSRPRGAI